MKLLRLRLENYRAFKELDLNFAEFDASGATGQRPRQRTVIVGTNGTCKSSILRAIVIGLVQKEDGNALVAEPVGRILKEGENRGKIRVTVESDKELPERQISTSLKNEGLGDRDRVTDQRGGLEKLQLDPFVCAYGASRGTFGFVPYRTFRLVDSCYGLFEYEQFIEIPELALRRIRDSLVKIHSSEKDAQLSFDQTLMDIMTAIGLGENDKLEIGDPGGGLFVSGPKIGDKIPFEGWADGFRLTMAYLVDLYSWALRHSGGKIRTYEDIEGILLIDELEHHLHPSLQRTALRRLSDLLPNLQIVVTTHSPFVVLDAIPEEVTVLKREKDQVRCIYPGPDMTGSSVEDVIVHAALFDTEPYSLAAEQRMTEYERLLGTPAGDMSEEERQKLRDLLSEMQRPAGEARSTNVQEGDNEP